MKSLNKEHLQILTCFLNKKVDFLLLGGHAAIFYGVRRTTSDIDILVRPTFENGERILSAFQELKLLVDDISPQDFEKNIVLSFGEEPNAVDLINYMVGVDIEKVFNNARIVNYDGFKVKMIDVYDLLANKESLNRTGEKGFSDQLDILVLKKIIAENREAK